MSRRFGRLTQGEVAALGQRRPGGLGFIMLSRHIGVFFDLPARFQKPSPEVADTDEFLGGSQ